MESLKSNLRYDLHFLSHDGELEVRALSNAGEFFLQCAGLSGELYLSSAASRRSAIQDVYTQALEAGLHISFETKEARDKLIS